MEHLLGALHWVEGWYLVLQFSIHDKQEILTPMPIFSLSIIQNLIAATSHVPEQWSPLIAYS